MTEIKSKPKKPEKEGNIFDSAKRMARLDGLKIKRLKIKSPDIKKMHCVSYGENHKYYFRTKEKLHTFIMEGGHYQYFSIRINPEDKVVPVITYKT